MFEQLVEVFSERDSVQRIVRRGTDFESFLDELVAVVGPVPGRVPAAGAGPAAAVRPQGPTPPQDNPGTPS